MTPTAMSTFPRVRYFVRSRLLGSLFPLILVALCLSVAFLIPHLAIASTSDTSTGSLPWESPLATLRTSFSGPVAYAISIIGIVVCGAMLIWGGEINEFGRRAIMIVLVIALIVLANSVLTSLFSSAATLDVASHAGTHGNGVANLSIVVAIFGAAYFNRCRVKAKARQVPHAGGVA